MKITAYKNGQSRDFFKCDYVKYASKAGWTLDKNNIGYAEIDKPAIDSRFETDDFGLSEKDEDELRLICRSLGLSPGGRSSKETIISKILESGYKG